MNNKPKRQHPFWMLTQLAKLVKDYIAPIVIFFILNLNIESHWITIGSLLLLLFLLYQLVSIVFQWKNYTYLITNTHLEINEGKFIARRRAIALQKIQSYQQQTAFYQRLFQLTTLTFVTGTTDIENSTVQLPMISENDAQRLIRKLKEIREDDESITEKTEDHSLNKHYRISFVEIVLFSISSFYFLIVASIILSIFSKIEQYFSLSTVISNQFFTLLEQSWILLLIVAFVIVLIIIFLGIVFTYLYYGNYTVKSYQKHIYISRGIWMKAKVIIPREKINGVIVEKTFPRRLFRIGKVKVVSLGDMLEEEHSQTDVLFPFIFEKRIRSLVTQIIHEFPLIEKMHHLPGRAYFVYLVQPSYLFVIVTYFIYYFWPEYWLVAFLYAIFLILFRIVKAWKMKFAYDETHIQFQSGVFQTKTFTTSFNKIDELIVHQSCLEQKLNLASVEITTRAKPVHVAVARHIPVTDALSIYEAYKKCVKTKHRVTEVKVNDNSQV